MIISLSFLLDFPDVYCVFVNVFILFIGILCYILFTSPFVDAFFYSARETLYCLLIVLYRVSKSSNVFELYQG